STPLPARTDHRQDAGPDRFGQTLPALDDQGQVGGQTSFVGQRKGKAIADMPHVLNWLRRSGRRVNGLENRTSPVEDPLTTAPRAGSPAGSGRCPAPEGIFRTSACGACAEGDKASGRVITSGGHGCRTGVAADRGRAAGPWAARSSRGLVARRVQ